MGEKPVFDRNSQTSIKKAMRFLFELLTAKEFNMLICAKANLSNQSSKGPTCSNYCCCQQQGKMVLVTFLQDWLINQISLNGFQALWQLEEPKEIWSTSDGKPNGQAFCMKLMTKQVIVVGNWCLAHLKKTKPALKWKKNRRGMRWKPPHESPKKQSNNSKRISSSLGMW